MQIKYFIFLPLVFLLFSCRKDRNPSPDQREHTLLVYMLAENSLYQNASEDLDEIVEGMRSAPRNFGVYVYVDDYGLPRLYEVNASGKRLIQSYNETNSAASEQLRAVFDLVKRKSPSVSYGMILWSHGYDWLPAPAGSRATLRNIQPRFFGQDGSKWMDIADIDAALQPNELLYLAFDACYMSGIELAYRLRHKMQYLMASGIEILGEGFPYQRMIPKLYERNINALTEEVLTTTAQTYFEYYQNHSNETERYGAMGVIRTDALEQLAQASRPILSSYSAWSNALLQSTQFFERQHNPSWVYDFRALMVQLGTPEQMEAVDAALAAAVLYKNATAFLPYSDIQIRDYCGLAVYIPAPAMSYNTEYMLEPWYLATHVPVDR